MLQSPEAPVWQKNLTKQGKRNSRKLDHTVPVLHGKYNCIFTDVFPYRNWLYGRIW